LKVSVKLLMRCAIALTCLGPAAALAQEPPPIPSSATEPEGFVAEPAPITRATLWADRHLGKGDLTNGIYVDRGTMIPEDGWLSAGPGYRHWYRRDSVFVDASAGIAVNSYKMAQARLELPKFLKSRLALGTQARWQDYGRVDYFGVGSTTTNDIRSRYRVESNQVTAYATLRPFRWLDVGGQVGWMNPEVSHTDGDLLAGFSEKRTFVPTEVSVTVDTRDFPGHPTSGIVLRGAGTHYDDRTTGIHTFRQYEGEAASFLPIAGGRMVLALHGWLVRTDAEAGRSVPFYLQPSLGGVNTLRSFTDYRFHDNHLLAANAELRLALMRHLDLALFADAGNVAAHYQDLNLDKRSYGAGFRLHTRRETFAMVDAANGDEGWRFLFRLRDPWRLSRLDRKTTLVPFVP
jgi:outer membrane protein assembly factor BamA